MRKIIVEAEVSVDGAMGGENTDFWKQVFPLHSPDVAAYLNDLLFTPDALLMGKKTYEFFRYFSFLKTESSVDRNVARAIQFLLGKGRFVARDKPKQGGTGK